MATFARTKRTEVCSGMRPLAEVWVDFDRYTPESRTESVGARMGSFEHPAGILKREFEGNTKYCDQGSIL